MLHNSCYMCSCACLQHSESSEVLHAAPTRGRTGAFQSF